MVPEPTSEGRPSVLHAVLCISWASGDSCLEGHVFLVLCWVNLILTWISEHWQPAESHSLTHTLTNTYRQAQTHRHTDSHTHLYTGTHTQSHRHRDRIIHTDSHRHTDSPSQHSQSHTFSYNHPTLSRTRTISHIHGHSLTHSSLTVSHSHTLSHTHACLYPEPVGKQ